MVGVLTVTATVMVVVADTTETISKDEGGDLMREAKDPGAWNPYVAGALTGLVSIGSVWVAGKYFGASTTFVRGTGFLEKFFDPAKVAGQVPALNELLQMRQKLVELLSKMEGNDKLDQLLADGESQTGSAAIKLGGEKGLTDSVPDFLRHPFTIVRDSYDDTI